MSDDNDSPSSKTPDPESPLGVDSLWRLVTPDGLRAAVPDPLLGCDLGGVTPVRMIAEGGMGRVYEARQEKPGRTVAVKVLRPGLVSREEYRRFANEAEFLGRLRHPAIAQVYAAGVFTLLDAQVPYFVMEYVPDALPITRFARDTRLPLAGRIALFRTVADAIAHGHAQGVIHRDLKPGNILVDGSGRPKVIDFGVARRLDNEHATTLTQLGQMLGTLQAMSPEQVSATPRFVDARSDVYSLGIVLYELLTDQLPYDLRNTSVVEAARIIQRQKPLPPHGLCRDIPRHVSDIVARCLAKDPRKRFPSAFELRQALDEAPSQQAAGWMTPIAASLGAGAALLAFATWGMPRTAPTRSVAMAVSTGENMPATEPTASSSCDFQFTTIEAADPYIVESAAMRTYREWQRPPITYLGPDENAVTAHVTYRFDFPTPARVIRLVAKVSCWDFSSQPGGVGRGAAAIDVSPDGSRWHCLRNGLEPALWGKGWDIDEELPPQACGTAKLWVRVRLVTENAPNTSYTTAQFGRSVATATAPVFAVIANVSQPANDP